MLWCSGFISCGSRAPEHRINSCGVQVSLFRGGWDLPGSGIEPVSPELQDDSLLRSHQGSPGSSFLKKKKKKSVLDLSCGMRDLVP